MAIALVTSVCIISEYVGEKEIIFPEISALAISAWILSDSNSKDCSYLFWLSPTAAALTGILVEKYLRFSLSCMIAIAFILVLLELKLVGSEIFPSFSAAILPILMNTQSWYYPLSVCIFTAILALGKTLIDNFRTGKNVGGVSHPASPKTIRNRFTKSELLYWLKILICILLVAELASVFHWKYIIAPPLIVAFVEITKFSESANRKFGLTYILLVTAAFSGVFWLWLIHYVLNWPIWISAALSVTCIYAFFYLFKFAFPPAAAITLLPSIIPKGSLFLYPWQAAIGSTIFILIGVYLIMGRRLPSLFNRKA